MLLTSSSVVSPRDLPSGCALEPPGMDAGLWATSAGPLLRIATPGSLAMYFPQGHAEQVASLEEAKIASASMPHPAQLVCRVLQVTACAEQASGELFLVYKLHPVGASGTNPQCPASEIDSEQQLNDGEPSGVWKVLSRSDAAPQGGMSLPKSAADLCLPPLDMGLETPSQVVQASDLFGNRWQFKHVFRGSPKRHLLTSNWASFVSAKKLDPSDRVLFLRGAGGTLRMGIRRSKVVAPLKNVSCADIFNGSAAAMKGSMPFNVTAHIRPTGVIPFVVPLDQCLQSIRILSSVSLRQAFKAPFETPDFSVRRQTGKLANLNSVQELHSCRSAEGNFADITSMPPLWRMLEVEWSSPDAHQVTAISPWEAGFVDVCSSTEQLQSSKVGSKNRRGSELMQPNSRGSSMLNSTSPPSSKKQRSSADIARSRSLDDRPGKAVPGFSLKGSNPIRELVPEQKAYLEPPGLAEKSLDVPCSFRDELPGALVEVPLSLESSPSGYNEGAGSSQTPQALSLEWKGAVSVGRDESVHGPGPKSRTLVIIPKHESQEVPDGRPPRTLGSSVCGKESSWGQQQGSVQVIDLQQQPSHVRITGVFQSNEVGNQSTAFVQIHHCFPVHLCDEESPLNHLVLSALPSGQPHLIMQGEASANLVAPQRGPSTGQNCQKDANTEEYEKESCDFKGPEGTTTLLTMHGEGQAPEKPTALSAWGPTWLSLGLPGV